MNPLQSRFRAALLGTALGDALGRPFEGASVRDPRLALGLSARAREACPWSYTDDTEMMINLGESLARCGRLDTIDVLHTLADNHDPARGYGKGMKLSFAALSAGARPERVAFAAWPEGSKGNGAAARVAPLACRAHQDLDTLATLADASAAITHAHPVGRAGCVLQALAIALALRLPLDLDPETTPRLGRRGFIESLSAQFARREADLADKLDRLATIVDAPPPPREVVALLGNGVSADESVPLAIFAFVVWYPSFEEVIVNAVAHGGDTDTIGAMSGAIIGAATGMSAIPPRWLDNLENGPRGRDHVISLADRLHA